MGGASIVQIKVAASIAQINSGTASPKKSLLNSEKIDLKTLLSISLGISYIVYIGENGIFCSKHLCQYAQSSF